MDKVAVATELVKIADQLIQGAWSPGEGGGGGGEGGGEGYSTPGRQAVEDHWQLTTLWDNPTMAAIQKIVQARMNTIAQAVATASGVPLEDVKDALVDSMYEGGELDSDGFRKNDWLGRY